MTVIKNIDAAEISRRAVVLDLSDLERQAERIIADGRRRAEEIVAAAETEASELVAGADARGYAAGEARGLAAGREEGKAEGRREAIEEYTTRLEQLVESWSDALARWDGDRQAMIVAAREDVLAFALTMAAKIVARVVELDPSVIEHQLAETLATLTRSADLAITINPADRSLVDQVLPSLLEKVAGAEHAQIREDEAVTRGGCLVHTGRGVIDATIEKQIDRIVQTLLPSRSEASAAGAGDAS